MRVLTAWDRQQKRLERLIEETQSNHGRFLVVTFPFVHAIGRNYEHDGIHQRLGQFWKNQGIPHLDLLSVFRSQAAADLVVNSNDAHPNVLAHHQAATAIAEFRTKNDAISNCWNGRAKPKHFPTRR